MSASRYLGWRKSTSLRSSHGRRRAFIVPSVISCLMLLALFLANFSHFAGVAFRQDTRVRAVSILAIDYDGGSIGQAVVDAYQQLKASSFPTLDFQNSSDYPDTASVRRAVCKGTYWAAMYTHEGASARLDNAITNSSASAGSYNAADAMTYLYNGARYPIVADSLVTSNLETLVVASRRAFYQTTGGRASLASLNGTDETAVMAYLNPIEATADVIAPTSQGSRTFLNTVFLIIHPLSQFFLVMALNGIGAETGFLRHARIRDVYMCRFAIGKVYTLLIGLVSTGCIWAFREGWAVTGAQFFETWMVLWFDAEVNWVVMESLVGSLIPMPFAPFFVMTWTLTNVISAIFPFEITPGWYRVGYALPAREVYTLLVQVWSGCADRLHIALPVLFAYYAVGNVGTVLSIRKRCLDAEEAAGAVDPSTSKDFELTGVPVSRGHTADDAREGVISDIETISRHQGDESDDNAAKNNNEAEGYIKKAATGPSRTAQGSE